MSIDDFVAKWSGSPLVHSSTEVLAEASLPNDVGEFLLQVGLPSNALWFVKGGNGSIMCLDSLVNLRVLTFYDVHKMTWEAITAMGCLRILGIFGPAFIVIDRRGFIWMIDGQKAWGPDGLADPSEDLGWRPKTFVNQGPSCFADCLIACKAMWAVFEREGYSVNSRLAQDAVVACRREILAADHQALANEESYWSQTLERIWG